MGIVSLCDAVGSAHRDGRAVPAFNVVDDVSMAAVLDIAEHVREPVIVQMSTRTAKFWRPEVVLATFRAMTAVRQVDATLHLDHCQDPGLITECLQLGWNSALYDASHLPYDQAIGSTRELVRTARRMGADIEGETQPIRSVADLECHSPIEHAADLSAAFIEATGVCCFSPDIGTAHGKYDEEPVLRTDILRTLAARTGVPLVLHGASGLSAEALREAITCGIRKINFSTALKSAYLWPMRKGAAQPVDAPLELLGSIKESVRDAVAECIGVVRGGVGA